MFPVFVLQNLQENIDEFEASPRDNGILKIDVVENPIINTITIEGEKAKKFKKEIVKFLSLKEKSSYVERNSQLGENFLR